MVWYENLNRKNPYIKDYRGWNLWYNYNNGKHHEMKRVRMIWFDHWLNRMSKHEGHARFFSAIVILPFLAWSFKTYKRFTPLKEQEEQIFSNSQYIANIGRNQFGFETRATKSFEHAIAVILGGEILGHILSQDSDVFRQEELGDEDKGLAGDFAEDDIVQLRKNPGHVPHVGIVFFRPEKHYLNEKPNDFLSPYKVVGEVSTEKKASSHHHH